MSSLSYYIISHSFSILPLTDFCHCHRLCSVGLTAHTIQKHFLASATIKRHNNSVHIQNRNLSTLHLSINFYFINHPITSHCPGANFYCIHNSHTNRMSHSSFFGCLPCLPCLIHVQHVHNAAVLCSRISSFDKCNKNSTEFDDDRRSSSKKKNTFSVL